MSTKIGLISDVHATPAPVNEALSIFKQAGVDMILCAGDIAGYGNEVEQTVELLITSGCQSIYGNHEVWYLGHQNEGNKSERVVAYFQSLPPVLDIEIEGKRLYMVHASPPRSYMDGIKLLDETGEILPKQLTTWTGYLAELEYDVLVVGHTHQVFAEQLGDTFLINPGSTKFNHTCVIIDLPEMTCKWFSLSNETPVKSWNWGMQYQQSQD